MQNFAACISCSLEKGKLEFQGFRAGSDLEGSRMPWRTGRLSTSVDENTIPVLRGYELNMFELVQSCGCTLTKSTRHYGGLSGRPRRILSEYLDKSKLPVRPRAYGALAGPPRLPREAREGRRWSLGTPGTPGTPVTQVFQVRTRMTSPI